MIRNEAEFEEASKRLGDELKRLTARTNVSAETHINKDS
jgi:hypothetical protein